MIFWSLCDLQGDESCEWPSKPKPGSPNPEDSKQDTIIPFLHYSTPDILQQNGVVANHEVKPVKWKVATDDLIVEEMGVENSPRRAVAMKLGLLRAQVATTLQEMSIAKAELKYLNLQIQQLNQVLKVISSTMF